jgi:hypothetical protein
VISVDVSLTNLIEHLNRLKPTPGGYAFLVHGHGNLIAAPPAALADILGLDSAGPNLSITETLSLSLADSSNPAFLRAWEAMQSGRSGLDRIEY